MSALETYAIQALTTKGTVHMAAIQSLRKYINLCSELELELAINRITDLDILRTLIEAGMRGNLHKVTVSRINMLIKTKEEATK
jgi:hypothetical protein